MGFATRPLTKGGTAIDPGRLPPFPPIRAHRHQSAYHISIFPNVFFSLYPDAFFRVRLAPSATDPNRTIEHATLQTLYLRYNKLGNAGTASLASALEKNSTLCQHVN